MDQYVFGTLSLARLQVYERRKNNRAGVGVTKCFLGCDPLNAVLQTHTSSHFTHSPTHRSSHFTHLPTHPHTSHTYPHILALHTLTHTSSHFTHLPTHPHTLRTHTPSHFTHHTPSHFTHHTLTLHTPHTLTLHIHSQDAPSALIWSFIGTLLLPRFVVMVTTVFLFRAKDNLRPTLVAKIHLCAALTLSLLEEIPNSVFTLALSNDCCQCP